MKHRPRPLVARISRQGCAPLPGRTPGQRRPPLYILYTSGSTGKPKGIVHTTGGYSVGTYITSKWIFDLKDEDIFWCTADIGWVTGHSYIVYGILQNGATTLMYEGAPNFPRSRPLLGNCRKVQGQHSLHCAYCDPHLYQVGQSISRSP